MSIVTSYDGPAVVLSVVALAVTPVILLFFRHYFRGLDFLQMCYLFAVTMATTTFSSHLTTAMLMFDRTLFNSCTAGDFICTNGFPLSLGVVLLALILFTFIFVAIQKCCGKGIEF